MEIRLYIHTSTEIIVDTLFQFKCCGALGPTDYSGSKWETNAGGAHTGRVPQSCCKVDSSNRCTQPTIVNIPDDVYQKVWTFK